MDKILEEVLLQIRKTWQRRWFIVPIAWLVAVAGWFWVDTLPDRYEASAQIYVNTESVLQPLLGGMTVTPNTEQRVRMMTRTLLSRSNLERVVRDAELDLLGDSDASQDQLIDQLSNSIRLQGAGSRDNVYTIRYASGDPDKAHDVVQTLVNMFMEGGIGSGRTDLASSQRFIESQIQNYREQLEEKESAIEEFKRDHAGLTPGQSGDYYNRLERVKDQLEQARLELREAENRRDTYQAQLDNAAELEQPGEGPVDPALQERIQNLENRLDELRQRYTDEHPEVASTLRILEDRKAERERQREQAGGPGSDREDVFRQQVRLSLSEAESRVSSLSARVEEFENRLDRLEEAVDRIPQIESQYASLMREKNVIQSNYEQLLDRRERAFMSGQVETQTDAVDFRVIEPPRKPNQPSDPNRPMLASAALVLGVGAGTGFAFLLAQLRATVTSRNKLAELTGRPVLGAVSFVETPRGRWRRRLANTVFFAALGLLFAVYAAVIASYFLL